ncbi:MAG: deoxyguanosinetriphosphate triphosphohydrolase [Chloroflexota bacterium]
MDIRERTEHLEEQLLSPLAARSAQSRGREHDEPADPVRTAYQRDRDRIVHSRAFRRLKHKTQVFVAPEGDHYRTRLTHTLEVAQIARTIAKALRLNEDLTEAIALGHDLGHTPFGHCGERTLDRALRRDGHAGFDHADQSVRVVEVLEGGTGLNLTWEVRNGILCHSYDEGRVAATLEGRVVSLSDRIAYINHDIDDAIRGNIIKPDDLPRAAIAVLGERHAQRIGAMVRDVIETSDGLDDIRMSADVWAATQVLHEWLFEHVYIDSAAKVEEAKAVRLVEMLFRHFREQPGEIPADFDASGDPVQRAVDYVAGMTDRYAVAQFERIFVPRAWKLEQ